MSSEGRGLTSARVILTDSHGVTKSVYTGRLGNFLFDEVAAGETYIISVAARRFNFSPKVLQVLDSMKGVDFVAGENLVTEEY